MAIFNKDKKADTPVKEEKKVVKKATKTAPAKEKKAKKPAVDAGGNLTKAPSRILKAPRVTEKAVYMTVNSTYVFEVADDATKRDVVKAIEALYGVTPRKVNTVRKPARKYVARMRNRRGVKSGLKKAYVFLKKGDKIDLA